MFFSGASHGVKPMRVRSSFLKDSFLVITTALFTFFYFLPQDIHSERQLSTRADLDSQAARRRLLSQPTLTASSRSDADAYNSDAIRPENGQANIAYFLQIADSTAGHLPRLLRRIYHPQNVYAIHFDLKMSPEVINSVKSAIWSANPEFERNVHFMPSELITYRGVSMVLNTINAMKFLLDKDQSWSYFINLSGSDYPLISSEKVRQLLGKHIEQRFNFVALAPKDKWQRNVEFRLQNFYIDEALGFGDGPSKVLQSSATNPLVERMKFEYANSEAWMINSREFCDFVVSDGYARKMLLTFAFSVEASEHYFASMLWNHPQFNSSIVPRSMRHVIWNHQGRSAGQHPFSVDEVQQDGSYTFREIVEKSPNFFIRKFNSPNSPLMDIIDNRMNHADRIAAVDKHYEWATTFSLKERQIKMANQR